MPAPFSGHDNKEVQAFNKFCEENSPVPYLDFYGVYDGGQALEGSGSTLDSPDTIDPNLCTRGIQVCIGEGRKGN